MPDLRSFDYIIVGGGTAACVLANRLTEDPAVRVLMLEAGPEPTSPWIKMPLAMGKLFTHPILNWGYYTEPEAQLNNRAVFWPRGRVLGGSSSINGSAYVRGHAEDYDGWRRLGNVGWGWSDVQPYFQKMERREYARGESRSGAGMVAVNYPTYVHPITRAFIEAGVRAGLPANDDLNGASSEGISLMPNSVRKVSAPVRGLSCTSVLFSVHGPPGKALKHAPVVPKRMGCLTSRSFARIPRKPCADACGAPAMRITAARITDHRSFFILPSCAIASFTAFQTTAFPNPYEGVRK